MFLDKNDSLVFWRRGGLLLPKFPFSQSEQTTVFSMTGPMICTIQCAWDLRGRQESASCRGENSGRTLIESLCVHPGSMLCCAEADRRFSHFKTVDVMKMSLRGHV